MKNIVLAVDIGTSSLKAALIDVSGHVISDARCRFPRSKRESRDWTDAFREALSILRPGANLAGLVISGNGPTLISVGSDDKPSSLLLWNDPIIPDASSKISRSIFLPRLRAYRTQFPESYMRARWIFSGPEYLIYHLTGNAVTILPESRFTEAYWTSASLQEADIDSAKLPPFVSPGTIVGKTNSIYFPELPPGIPVIAGGPDFVVALIGTGTLETGKACDRAGTSEGLNICTSSPISDPGIRTLPSVVSSCWNASYLLSETGALFHEYRKESGQINRSYPDIMREIIASPIFPKDGEVLHNGRSIVEQIGFSVRTGIAVLQKATGISPIFCLSGGQARNEIWNQLKADITGSVFALTTTPDGELMGNAVIGFTALGEYASFAEGARAMVRIQRLFEPDTANLACYSEKYAHYENI